MMLVADDQAPEIAQPGEEPFDFPPFSVATERAAILGLRPGATAPVRRDHLDAQQVERHIQGVGIVAAVTDQSAGDLSDEAGVEGRSDEGNLSRRSRGDTSGERKTKTV